MAVTKPLTALRVLVVEDEAIVATLLADLLVEMGHEVCAIEATEADAISAAVRLRPDLMIVDIHLREGNGTAAITFILRGRFVPHVLVSGDELSDLPSPRSVFLQKPFRERDLVRAIEHALGATIGA